MVYIALLVIGISCIYWFDSILGEVGSATKMKLVLNILIGSTLAGLAESLALASKLGLDTNEVLQIINNSTASSQFLREKGSGMLKMFQTFKFENLCNIAVNCGGMSILVKTACLKKCKSSV